MVLTTENSTFTVGPPERRNCATTIQHWQLRDLVVPGDNNEEVYTVYDSTVLCYNTRTDESTTVQNLSFLPYSLCCNHGYMAAGGQSGQLAVKDLERKRLIYNSTAGDSVNNALHIAPAATGGLQLFACNNDLTVRVLSVPSMTPVVTLRCPVAMNYAALSPDGRHLACVGDSETVVVYQARESGYDIQRTFREATDAGFSCAWSPTNTYLATAHQDGCVVVFDMRSDQLVHKYKLSKAARSVKFSVSVVDLIAFSEHEDMAHLADTRMWDSTQQLNAGSSQGRDVSGVCFSHTGTKLFVGLDDYMLEYDIDTCARRSFASVCLS